MPRCDHAAFRVADLDRSIAFYERLLPARLASRKRTTDRWRTEIATLRPVGADGGDDDFALVLLRPSRVAWLLRAFHALVPRQTRSHEHLGFSCGSRAELERAEAAARELGARVATPLTHLPEKDAWILEVHDPDRNAVEWVFGNLH